MSTATQGPQPGIGHGTPRVALSTTGELAERAAGLAAGGRRVMLGLAGAPGAGKSTAAAAIVTALGAQAALVPMDGFHLAQAELERLGRADRKGAPDTFDAAGFVALLRRLRAAPAHEVVYAPAFDRGLEEPVAGSIGVPPDVPLVVVEGNYLLHEEGAWAEVATVLDECWYVEVEEVVRRERLVARHVAFGKDPDAARAWAAGPDQRNADLIATTRHRADGIVRL